jgi:class 3 adenylate cyclase
VQLLALQRQQLPEPLQAALGTAQRAVWFCDMKGSSDAAAQVSPKDLIHEALLCFSQHRGSDASKELRPPLMVNTWGDCIIAVFTDARSAAYHALQLRNLAAQRRIMVRIGGAFGDIELYVNPFLGADASGKPVNLAARMEPLATVGSFLVDEAFRVEISSMQEFRVGPGQVKHLEKPVNELPKHAAIMLFPIHDASLAPNGFA